VQKYFINTDFSSTTSESNELFMIGREWRSCMKILCYSSGSSLMLRSVKTLNRIKVLFISSGNLLQLTAAWLSKALVTDSCSS